MLKKFILEIGQKRIIILCFIYAINIFFCYIFKLTSVKKNTLNESQHNRKMFKKTINMLVTSAKNTREERSLY